MLFYVEEIISSKKCIFDEIFYKQVLALFKCFGCIMAALI